MPHAVKQNLELKPGVTIIVAFQIPLFNLLVGDTIKLHKCDEQIHVSMMTQHCIIHADLGTECCE